MVDLDLVKGGSSSSNGKPEQQTKSASRQQDDSNEANSEPASNELLRLEKVDLQLVDKLRDLIKPEFKNNPDKYSARHFEEIVDKSSVHTCWRYLVYSRLNLEESFELVKAALAWRKKNQADEPLGNQEVSKEFFLFSPLVRTGLNKSGEHVLYMMGKNYRRPNSLMRNAVKRFVIRTIFDFDQVHAKDFSQLLVVFDVSQTGYRNFDLEFMSWLISVRDFIPARIASIHVIGVPFVVRPIVRLIISWLPHNFSQLVKCGSLEDLLSNGDLHTDQLPVEISQSTAPDESYRVAPDYAPWLVDSLVYSDPDMIKAWEDAQGFSMDTTRREKLVQMERQRIAKKELKSLRN